MGVRFSERHALASFYVICIFRFPGLNAAIMRFVAANKIKPVFTLPVGCLPFSIPGWQNKYAECISHRSAEHMKVKMAAFQRKAFPRMRSGIEEDEIS